MRPADSEKESKSRRQSQTGRNSETGEAPSRVRDFQFALAGHGIPPRPRRNVAIIALGPSGPHLVTATLCRHPLLSLRRRYSSRPGRDVEGEADCLLPRREETFRLEPVKKLIIVFSRLRKCPDAPKESLISLRIAIVFRCASEGVSVPNFFTGSRRDVPHPAGSRPRNKMSVNAPFVPQISAARGAS